MIDAEKAVSLHHQTETRIKELRVMKTISNIKYLLLIVMIAMTGMTFSSCSDDDENNNDNTEAKTEALVDEAVREVKYTIIDEEELTSDELADEVFGPSGANSENTELEVMRAAFLEKQKQLAEEVATEIGANGWALLHKSVVFKYESVDEQGKPVTLSAKVYWGTVPLYGALDPNYMVLYPHNPALTFQKYFEQKKHPYPCVFPFTIKAMMAAYPEILGKWSEDDFYSKDFVENHKSLMDEMVARKEFSCDKINAKFFEWYPHKGENDIKGGKEIWLTDILSPEVLDTNSEIYKALFQCLDKNNLTKGWTPKHKIKLYHGKADEIVPYANSEAVRDAFPDMVEFSTSMSGTDGHIGTCVKWLGQIMLNIW